MKTFLRQNAAEVFCGMGLVLLIAGAGMVYLPMAPITAGVASLVIGVLIAKSEPQKKERPE